MYGKALLFNDPETAALILETSDPKSQKFLGRAVRHFDEKVWLANREKIVEGGERNLLLCCLIHDLGLRGVGEGGEIPL